ncbi:DUF1850 domain-containing protein [Natronobeatus ordinarius]|uniref:DUF1850 domain-containing protein n=1 Tax=Natronobeatus ordinarius TaxID=2963433 RepID=UPI0020CD3A2D|nr:DUF1850 domain-containing protein [Natronobeatus ordinarius]
MTDHHDGTPPNTTRLRRRTIVAALASLPLGAGAVAVARSSDRTLVVADADSGDRLLEQPVDDGETVVLAYTHSVEKTPVRDVYEVDDDALRMVRMEFSSFGAGLPTDDVERTDEGFVVHRDDRYEQLSVAPRTIAGHELVVGETRYDLVAIADDRVTISIAFDRFLSADRFAHDMSVLDTTDGLASDVDNGVSRRP